MTERAENPTLDAIPEAEFLRLQLPQHRTIGVLEVHVGDARCVLFVGLHRIEAGVGGMSGVEAHAHELRWQIQHGALDFVLVFDPAAGMRVQCAVDAVALCDLGDLFNGIHELGPQCIAQTRGIRRAAGRSDLLLSHMRHDDEELGPMFLQGLARHVDLLQDGLDLGWLMEFLEYVSGNELKLQGLEFLTETCGIVVAHRTKLCTRVAGLRDALDHALPRRVRGALGIVDTPRRWMVANVQRNLELVCDESLSDHVANLKSLDRGLRTGDTLGSAIATVEDVIDHRLLQVEVLAVLKVEIRHAAWRCLLQLGLLRHDLRTRPHRLEGLHANLGDDGLAVLPVTAIAPEDELLTRFSLDRASDPGEVCDSVPGLLVGVRLISDDLSDAVDREAVVSHESQDLMAQHVLHHALCVALEALVQALRGVEAVVTPERESAALGRRGGGQEVVGKPDVLAEIPVVAHEDGDILGLGVGGHFLKLLNRGRTWFLEVDVRAPAVDNLAEQLRVVSGPPADHRKFRARRLGHLGDRAVKRDALGGRGGSPLRELFAHHGVLPGTKEERLHDICEGGVLNSPLEKLQAMVPAHATLWRSTSYDHHLNGRLRHRS
mmetsp:Transcript_22873/g.58274  ORF Transcript_22873/g.58274 Transcript_22873/m.58274 type:complete len:605 (+) Transcript_22873:409-2223(+)